MLLGLTLLLVVILAGFESVRYWRVRTRQDVDFFELDDLVKGLVKRDKSERARERVNSKRIVEGDREAPVVDPSAGTGSPFGGVVRSQAFTVASAPETARRKRG